jgi:hypothetical protein
VSSQRLRILVIVLLVVSAGLFAVGVAIERSSKHQVRSEAHAAVGLRVLLVADQRVGESPAHRAAETKHRESTTPAKPATGTPAGEGKPGHKETGPAPAAGESPAHRAGESTAHLASEAHGERVFGIDIESTGLVVAAVAVSLVLAIALWLSSGVVVPLALAGFALVAAIFDVREVFHQIDESLTNLTVISAIVAALHLAVVAGAFMLARRSTLSDAAPSATPGPAV